MKYAWSFLFIIFISGCASGRLNIIDQNGNLVGECTAGYEWHPYGVKDSVDWLLNYCAQIALANDCDNCSVSDESILLKDYTIPTPPEGKFWNKKLARQEFKGSRISEQKYGYILASIENEFYLKTREAKQQLSDNVIGQDEYESLIEKAKLNFYGE